MLRDAAMLEFEKRDEVLDVYHALEHLSDCGKILYGAGTKEFDTWRDETTLELLWNGFELIEKRLDQLESEKQTDVEKQTESEKRMESEEQTGEEKRTNAEKEAIRVLRGYLAYHSGRLGYRDRLATGKSIGSGQVEGACKNLIDRRLKQTGARWRVRRVNNMATLCAVLHGDQWKLYRDTAKSNQQNFTVPLFCDPFFAVSPIR